jgi:exosortase/archaeosortase family protein
VNGRALRINTLVLWWRARPVAFRFVVRAALLMGAFYSILYYPYADSSVPARLLFHYLESLAWMSGRCVSLFDSGVRVDSVFITGRQSLQIVLDCAALDALALFAATVLAFPASLKRKLTGFAVGSAIIWGFNLFRIVVLYVAGVKWPGLFDILHEDVMALLLVLVSVACFAVWAALIRNNSGRMATHASNV